MLSIALLAYVVLGRQAAIFWDWHGGKNPKWAKGVLVPRSRVTSSASILRGGHMGTVSRGSRTAEQAAQLIVVDAGTLIGADTGTRIAAGGQNLLYIVR